MNKTITNSLVNPGHKIFGCLLITFLLVGCSSIHTPKLKPAASWQQHQKNISSLTAWHAMGKIGCTNGHKGGSANLDWQQSQTHFDINLYGPFRTENIRLTGQQPGAVQLTTAAGINQTAKTPAAIIEQQLGWPVPVAGLMYWSRGIPMPNVPVTRIQLSTDNRLMKLTQQGWTIEYSDYQAFSKFILPTKITLKYKDIKIKLIFKNWL